MKELTATPSTLTGNGGVPEQPSGRSARLGRSRDGTPARRISGRTGDPGDLWNPCGTATYRLAARRPANSTYSDTPDATGLAGYGYVQASPPAEQIQGSQWWTSYQPVSYQIAGRLGDAAPPFPRVRRSRPGGPFAGSPTPPTAGAVVRSAPAPKPPDAVRRHLPQKDEEHAPAATPCRQA